MPEKTEERVSIWERKIPRRAFIKSAPIASAVAPEAVGQIMAAVCLSTGQFLWKRAFASSRPATPTFQPVDIETAFKSPRHFLDALDNLDAQIAAKPESTLFSLNQAIKMATRYFELEMGITPSSFTGNFSLEEESLFLKRMAEINGCVQPSDASEIHGYLDALDNTAHLNLDFILYKDRVRKIRRSNPTAFALAEAIHELHHLRPPLKKLATPEQFISPHSKTLIPATLQKGVVSFAESPKDSLPGKTCLIRYRYQVEEAVAQDSTDRMLAKIGIRMVELGNYDTYVQIYRRMILDPLFAGDHRPLLSLQQSTEKARFFASIGSRLSIPKGQEEKAGEDFLASLFVNR